MRGWPYWYVYLIQLLCGLSRPLALNGQFCSVGLVGNFCLGELLALNGQFCQVALAGILGLAGLLGLGLLGMDGLLRLDGLLAWLV